MELLADLLAAQACLAEALPREPWDIPLQGWVSEKGITWLTT